MFVPYGTPFIPIVYFWSIKLGLGRDFDQTLLPQGGDIEQNSLLKGGDFDTYGNQNVKIPTPTLSFLGENNDRHSNLPDQ